jgi:hypothetical protein
MGISRHYKTMTKQKPRLDFDGRSYVKDPSTSEKTYWRYIKYLMHNCHSRIHTCKTDRTAFELRKFDE